MLKNIVSLLCLFSTNIWADSPVDYAFIKSGIANSNFEIVDIKRFDEEMRRTTNNLSSITPSKVDSSTTILSIRVYRFGIFSDYQIDDIETKDQALSIMQEYGLAKDYKNYICSSELFKSNVLKKLNLPISMNLINSQYKVIYTLRWRISEC